MSDDAPFLPTHPSPWAMRSLATILIAVSAAAVAAALAVQVPETVESAFVLVPSPRASGPQLQASLEILPRDVARVEAGQGVKLLYEAFPYQRYGVRGGTLSWVGPAAAESQGREFFPALADVADEAITVQGRPRPLRAGMRGRARIVVGRRRLASYAFEALR
jgi:multidrug efflux pump subunit AcrA (membrane-fusion protein)